MATTYRIRVNGYLDEHWSDWFDGLTIFHDSDGGTSLVGAIPDQAALYGLLAKARDLGLMLLAVERVTPRGIASDDAADVAAQK